MNSDDQPATKVDVEEIVTRVVTGAIDSATTKILTAVGEQLNTVNDHIDERFEQVDDRFDRLESKVDNITDDLVIRVTKLEKQQV